jgi:hypothetical protein
MIEAPLEHFMPGEPGLRELEMTLRDIAGKASRVTAVARIHKRHKSVYRILLARSSGELSLVSKRLTPSVAHRNQLAIERWLPAAGLARATPALVGVAAERAGRSVWHLYEDLGGCTLMDAAADRVVREAAVRLVAMIHARFAEGPLLAECRVWGEDHGIGFYDSSVRDATCAVSTLLDESRPLTRHAAPLERLLVQLQGLGEERDERARALAALGGPDTLLHGDLWPTNVAVVAQREKHSVSLLDWDKVGPGSFAYDLSVLALRVPAPHRAEVVGLYRDAAADHGIRLPDDADLDALFTTVESARLANTAIWPALVAAERGSPWAFQELAEVDGWLAQLRPRCAV